MDQLIYLFVAFVDKIRSLVGLVIPIFADAADFRNWPSWVKILVHVIMLGLMLYGLYILNRYVQKWLLSKATITVQDFYLPILGVLLYLLSWTGYFIWQYLNATDKAEYADIEQAWRDGVKRLESAGVRLKDYPLYLVVGRPATEGSGMNRDDSLFVASQLQIGMRAPNTPEAPIRLYSSSEGIYVTAGSASGWGFFTDALASPNRGSALEGSQNGPDLTKTITVDNVGGGAVDPQIQEEFFYLHREKASRPLSPAEQYRLRELGELLNQALPTKAKAVQLTPEELTHGPKRLAYLCDLIKNERNPVCPINGVL
ncbi:MAG: hypothetical protein ACRCZF_26070, partial [Gemmataceae bacterium]